MKKSLGAGQTRRCDPIQEKGCSQNMRIPLWRLWKQLTDGPKTKEEDLIVLNNSHPGKWIKKKFRYCVRVTDPTIDFLTSWEKREIVSEYPMNLTLDFHELTEISKRIFMRGSSKYTNFFLFLYTYFGWCWSPTWNREKSCDSVVLS